MKIISNKSFENFKYPKTPKYSSIWNLDNYADNYHTSISGNTPNLNNKDFIINNIDNNSNKKDEEDKIDDDEEYFNYASFEIEEDISKKINEYFSPNISDINNPKKNKYGYFYNFKDDHKFKKPKIIREKKPGELYNELYNEYYEDFKTKINMVKNGEKLVKKLNQEEDMKKKKKSESAHDLPNPKLNKNKQRKSLPSVILEEHLKNK